MTGVCLLGEQDVEEVADLHARALPEDVLPAFGRLAVQSYYRMVLASRRVVLLGCRNGSALEGFVLVSMNGPSILSLARQMFVPLALRGALLLLRRPGVALDALVSSLRLSAQPLTDCEVSYIAVDPKLQSRGVGLRLVEGIKALMEQRDFATCRTKTLASNEHVVRLYRKVFSDTEVIPGYRTGRRDYVFFVMHRRPTR